MRKSPNFFHSTFFYTVVVLLFYTVVVPSAVFATEQKRKSDYPNRNVNISHHSDSHLLKMELKSNKTSSKYYYRFGSVDISD